MTTDQMKQMRREANDRVKVLIRAGQCEIDCWTEIRWAFEIVRDALTLEGDLNLAVREPIDAWVDGVLTEAGWL